MINIGEHILLGIDTHANHKLGFIISGTHHYNKLCVFDLLIHAKIGIFCPLALSRSCFYLHSLINTPMR